MKILIFTSSAGNGHNSTAKRIKEKVLENNKKAEFEIVDVYKEYASKLKAWTMEQGYFLACNHFVSLYNYFFKKSEKSSLENKDKSKVNKEVYPLLHGMLDKIYSFKPDIIISTYIFCSVALTNIKRYYEIPATTICMTLDYGISPYWECCAEGLDYMFLTDDYMLKPFKEKGYSDKQLIVSGIPVSDKFATPIPTKIARKDLKLDENLFTIIVMKASFFPISNKNLFKQFSKVNPKIQIIFVNGKNEKTKKDIENKIKKYNLQHKIINIGFTDKIVEYMSASDLVLGKAGGLSTTESINIGLPSLIVSKLPQQEIYNKEFLIKNNCAISVNSKNIANTINQLMKNNKLYKTLKNNTLKLRKPDALNKFYEILSKCKKANYKNLVLTDNKKQLIKNIDKKRKEAIKNSKDIASI
jgi:processive 1,2-diacylglycerol beta-glucosyltransferase